MSLRDVLEGYNSGVAKADTLREKARKAEKKASEAGALLSISDHLARPLAEALMPHLGADSYDILGPFGLGMTTSIEFLAAGERVGYLTFEPWGVEEGRLLHVAYRPSEVREPMPDGLDEIAGLAREHAESLKGVV